MIVELCVLLLALLVPLWFFVSESVRNRAKLPPGPFNLPVLGSIHRLGGFPHISLHQLSRRYGDLMFLKLGSVPVLVVSSERAAQEIYRLYSFQIASKFPLISGKYFGNNYSGVIFSSYNSDLKSFRKLINTHLLSVTKMKQFEGIRREEYQQLVRRIHDLQGKPVFLRQMVYEMNLNIITCMLFGKRFFGHQGESSDEFVQLIVETLTLAGVFNIGDYIPALRLFDLQGYEREYKRLMQNVNAYLMSMLHERRANPPNSSSSEEPVTFIDVLISMDSTDEKLPDIVKISLLFDLLLGAVDSSGVAIEWVTVELLRHPAELARAREDIDAVVGRERLAEESDIPNLRFIQAIAKESMRLHMSTPLPIPKIVEGGPIELSGYRIPDGTVVFLNTYSIAMDESYWKEPFKFRPQRFIESDVDIFGQNFNLLPFGAGRRICPAFKFGFDTVLIGLALLLQVFDWGLKGGVDPAEINMEASFGLVCHKAQPLVAVPTPRVQLNLK